MPRTKAQYEQMRVASENKIRQSAVKLFVQKGFAATSIQEIAEDAGISLGLMYRHYKSKEALFTSLINNAINGLKRLTEVFKSEADPREVFESISAEIYMDIMRGDDFLNDMMLITQAKLSKNNAGSSIIDSDNDVGIIHAAAKMIRRGQLVGEFGVGDPYEMSVLYFANIQGLTMLKSILQTDFKMPSTQLLTAFLYKGCNHE